MPGQFSCTWTNDDLDAPWVHVSGRLDVTTTPYFERTLREAQLHVSEVVLDLRRMSSIDGFAVGRIVDACTRSRAGGATLRVVQGPTVHPLLTLAGG